MIVGSVRYFPVVMLVEQIKTSRIWRLDSVMGSVKLCKTFRQISEVWENPETLNLKKYFLCLCHITLQFLDFIN